MAVINVDDIYILNETGEQVDKVTGLFTKDEGTTEEEKEFAQLNIGTSGGGGGGGRNLLDNPWFTVNQRGLTSGTHTTMPADRWKATYGSGGMNWTRESDGCITFGPTNTASHGDIYQRIPDDIYDALAGTDKTVTVSVMLQDGTIYSGTSYLPPTGTRTYIDIRNVGGTSSRLVVYVQASTKQLFVQAFYGSLTVKAVKLEKGSVPTLENDAPPDYGTELAKCQRYFVRLNKLYCFLGVGFASTTTSAWALIPTPVPLRESASTVTISYQSVYVSAPSGIAHAITAITANNSNKAFNACGVSVTATTTGLTSGEALTIMVRDAGGYVDISADL